MPARSEEFRSYGHPSEMLFAACRQAVAQAGFQTQRVDPDNGLIEARTSSSLKSWGENVVVQVRHGGVAVASECALATQVVDWGKNKNNVQKFLALLEAILPHGPLPDPPEVVPPPPPAPPFDQRTEPGRSELPRRKSLLFISYAHADRELHSELLKHLRALERERVVESWHDRMIAPGSEWENAIDEYLGRADLVLLLVSSDFMSSSYCYDKEMARALERHDRGEAIVIPIIIRPVSWKGAPFGRLQALPRDARPVTEWPNRDSAYVDIVDGIRAAALRRP